MRIKYIALNYIIVYAYLYTVNKKSNEIPNKFLIRVKNAIRKCTKNIFPILYRKIMIFRRDCNAN